jgi:undecaprenyl-diphosphatase
MAPFENWDLELLHYVNLRLIHPYNDFLMKLWSAEWPWAFMVLFFLVRWCLQKDWARLKTLLWMGLTVGLCDLLAAQLIKPWVERLRPCKVEGLVRVVDGCAGMMGFPSNHAANAFAFAILWFSWAGARQGWLALGSASVIGFSRVYLGVHYPSDILGGCLLGITIGGLSALLLQSKTVQGWIQKKKGAEAP